MVAVFLYKYVMPKEADDNGRSKYQEKNYVFKLSCRKQKMKLNHKKHDKVLGHNDVRLSLFSNNIIVHVLFR